MINEKVLKSINETVQMLIDKGYNTFLYGSKSQFNDVCYKIVNNFKKCYPLEIKNAGKSCYANRNYIMIDKPNCCVFYYDCNYQKEKSRTQIECNHTIKT